MASYSSTLTMSDGFVISANKPIDVRTVVDTYEDLVNVARPYTGIVVGVKGTADLYVLTSSIRGVKKLSNWVKVGGSDFKPEDYTSYYNVKVKDTPEELTSVENAYQGMLVYVKDNADTSEDESGLYILVGDDSTVITNWKKVTSGGGSGDVQSVITTDGTIPTSNSGIKVTKIDSTDVEEVYADDETGTILFYTEYKASDGQQGNSGYSFFDYKSSAIIWMYLDKDLPKEVYGKPVFYENCLYFCVLEDDGASNKILCLSPTGQQKVSLVQLEDVCVGLYVFSDKLHAVNVSNHLFETD